MKDIERERDFYRQQYRNLGTRILRLQEKWLRVQRESRRNRTTATLILEAHRLISADLSISQIGERFIQLLLDTLYVDRAAIFNYRPDQAHFAPHYALGFSPNEPSGFILSDTPADFFFGNSDSAPSPLLASLRQVAGVPYLLWAFDAQAEVALLIGNATEDQHLHRPFEEEDRVLMEGALNVFIDVIERKRAKEELQWIHRLIEMSHDAFVAINREGLIILFNPAAEEMFRRKKKDTINRPIESLVPGANREMHRQFVEEYFREYEANEATGKSIKVVGLRSNGDLFPMEMSISVGQCDGRPCALAVIRDSAGRKQRAEEHTASLATESRS